MFTNKSAELRKTNYGRSINVTDVGKFTHQEAEIESSLQFARLVDKEASTSISKCRTFKIL